MPESSPQGDADAAPSDPSAEKIELLVRRILDDEAGKFRADAIGTLKLLVAAFFGVVVVAGVIGAWLFSTIFGETLESRAIDSIIGSQVDGVLQQEVTARAAEAVEQIATEATQAVESGVEAISTASTEAEAEAMQEITENISSRVEDVITTQLSGPIQEELDRLQGQDAQEIISGVFRDLFAEGAVVAFARESCPSGWQRFEAATGRFVLGAGQGQGLANRPLGDTGGEEQVQLTIAQMPAHDHGGATGNNLQQVISAQAGGVGRVGRDGTMLALTPDAFHTHSIQVDGGDEPHNNMPPYIALHFCEYVGEAE